MRPRIWFLALFIALVAGFPRVSIAGGKQECLVTRAPDPPFVPPAPFHVDSGNGEFLFGSPALWAVVQRQWQVHGFSGSKLPYFSHGLDSMKERNPRLTVVARRIDGPDPLVWAGPANASISGGSNFMVTGLSIPAAGCWEIAAHYVPPDGHSQTLAYTVWVEP